MFKSQLDQENLDQLLGDWQTDNLQTSSAFAGFRQLLESFPQVVLSFNGRPGITYSLRAFFPVDDGEEQLLAMVDIIDDDPQSRWLSVCMFARMISDPEEGGDLVPGGLQGEDAICFDYDRPDPAREAYIAGRLREAHAFCVAT